MTRAALLALVLASVTAWAQPLSQVLKGDALAAYEAARVDFKGQRYQQALLSFEKAWSLSREPRLKWNAAACLRKLERNAEALRKVDAYVAEAQAELTREDLDEARRSQDALRQLVAVVTVLVSPADARVSIDGSPLEGSSSRSIYLEPGRHALVGELEGFQPAIRQETVAAGQRLEWTVALSALEVAPPPPVVVVQQPPQPPPAPIALRPVWVPLAVAGLGAAAAVTGGALLGGSSDEYERLRVACLTRCAPTQWASARDREVGGVVLISAGSVAAAAALAWAAWWLFEKPRVVVSPGAGSLHVEVAF